MIAQHARRLDRQRELGQCRARESGQTAYCAEQGGARRASRVRWPSSLAPFGIRVNALAPRSDVDEHGERPIRSIHAPILRAHATRTVCHAPTRSRVRRCFSPATSRASPTANRVRVDGGRMRSTTYRCRRGRLPDRAKDVKIRPLRCPSRRPRRAARDNVLLKRCCRASLSSCRRVVPGRASLIDCKLEHRARLWRLGAFEHLESAVPHEELRLGGCERRHADVAVFGELRRIR